MRRFPIGLRIAAISFLGIASLWGATPETTGETDPLRQSLHAAAKLAHAEKRSATRADALVELAAAYAHAGDKKAADQTAGEALRIYLEHGWQDEALVQFCRRLAGEGLNEAARRAANAAATPTVRIIALCALAQQQADNGQGDPALRSLREALEALEEVQTPRVLSEALGSILGACESLGETERVDDVLADLLVRAGELTGEERDEALKKLARTADAVGETESAKRSAGTISGPPTRAGTYVTLAEVAADRSAQDVALSYLRSAETAIRDADPADKVRILSAIARGYAETGSQDRADTLLKQARREIENAPEKARPDAATALLNALLDLGSPDEALTLVQQTPGLRVRGSALHRIARRYAESGDYEKATRAARMRKNENMAAISLLTVAGEAARRGDYARADSIIQSVRDPAHRRSAYRSAAVSAAANGDFDAARRFAGQLEDPAQTRSAVSDGLTTYISSGSPTEEPVRAERLMEQIEQFRLPGDRARILISAIRGHLAAGNRKKAEAVAGRLARLNNRDKIGETAAEAGELLAELGMREEARTFFGIAAEEVQRTTCGVCLRKGLAALRERMTRAGLVEAALSLAGGPGEGEEAVGVLLKTAELRLESGETKRGRDHLVQALELLRTVSDTARQVALLARIGQLYERHGPAWGPEESRAVGRLLEAGQKGPGPAASGGGTGQVHLLYFFSPGCAACKRVSAMLDRLEEAHPDANVVRRNILKPDSAKLNKGLCMDLGLPEHQHAVAPAVFAPDRALVDREITLEALKALAESSRGRRPPWLSEQELRAQGAGGMEAHYSNLTLLVVLGAGLADGVNPCAFAVIIFFLTYMAYVGKSRREIVLAGIIYTAAVFLTYLAIGIGLHRLLEEGLALSNLLRRIIYVGMAALLVVAAVLSLRDGIHCLRGETDKVTLKLPDALKRRIHLQMTRQTRRGLTVFGALSLGVVVALLEFPCTGQTYIPIITYLSVNPVGALGWLVLYNLCFILPLVVIFLCILFGTSSEQIRNVFQRNMGRAKFALATIFAVLAAVLLLTMP
mgnify:CR=1 FL=1